MNMQLRPQAALGCFLLAMMAASIQTPNPSRSGLSPERLVRIQTVQHHIDIHDISGAVTLVARTGRLAYFEAQGTMDRESNQPISKDALFWIASMSKPITGVAILMLMEEGEERANDPISKFIPEFRGLKVAVMQERTGPPGRSRLEPRLRLPSTRFRLQVKSLSATC